jgi:hypothetical protein
MEWLGSYVKFHVPISLLAHINNCQWGGYDFWPYNMGNQSAMELRYPTITAPPAIGGNTGGDDIASSSSK